MKRVIVTGANGQIGTELVNRLRAQLGNEQVLATDIHPPHALLADGPFEIVDVTDGERLRVVTQSFQADTMMHMAALLSATAEGNPMLAWHINMNGLVNALEVAREMNLSFFTPSSIGAFGPSTPKINTPQLTIQRPTTMYGVNKVSGELLCDYYFHKFGVDTRGVRFPGLISHVAEPGGGTTDYAVDIFYSAIQKGKYTSYIGEGTYMDMMYMPDAIDAIIDLMMADDSRLITRNAFNVSGMSFAPEQIAAEIKKHIPTFEMTYEVDPVRQAIADSWPDSIETIEAQEQWGFKAKYNLTTMTEDMLHHIAKKYNQHSL